VSEQRPFRFIAPMPRLEGSAGAWRDSIRRIEDLGFSTLSVSDHFTAGWVMEPLTALTAGGDKSPGVVGFRDLRVTAADLLAGVSLTVLG
jgi:hypothetical protein